MTKRVGIEEGSWLIFGRPAVQFPASTPIILELFFNSMNSFQFNSVESLPRLFTTIFL